MNTDFFDKTGRVAIGSRLRMLTDMITNEMADVYKLYGVNLKPKWFPVFRTLADDGPATITEIARRIGHSHPSVSNIVKEMAAGKIVRTVDDKTDGRRTKVALTQHGQSMSALLDEQCIDVAAAVDNICRNTRNDLWRAIAEWEELLNEKPMLQRVRDERQRRIASMTEIVDYTDEYQSAFKQLNEEWITSRFVLEDIDKAILSDPRGTIIDKGGHILVALYNGQPAGVVAMVPAKISGYDFDIEKYAVGSQWQGRGIGTAMLTALIERAKSLGARKLFLETNSTLRAAIHVYKKLGFTQVFDFPTEYARADVLMELVVG